MEIKSEFEHGGKIYKTHWVEDDPTKNLSEYNKLSSAAAICFYGDKIVIVLAGKKGTWAPPGGSIEAGETYEEAVIREVKEEANMKVLYQECIGYQDVSGDDGRTIRQTRSFCIVEPYGDFESDPDGDITEIKLIDPQDYKKYFDWGVRGDRIMERAMEIKRNHHEG
jgi:ADP-ribose pyrophosphatase YjhB (NUDIX family)